MRRIPAARPAHGRTSSNRQPLLLRGAGAPRPPRLHKAEHRDRPVGVSGDQALHRHDVNGDEGAAPSTCTITEFFGQWMGAYGRTHLAPLTYERYDSIIRTHIVPTLGHVQLQNLAPLQVDRMYLDALDSGLSASTVLYIHRVLHCALAWATRKRLVTRNVADSVDRPRASRPETRALDEDATAAVLDLLQRAGSDLYLPALVAVSTGVRRGELLALRWADFDFGTLIVTVGRALQDTREDGLTFKTPKNGRARLVGIPHTVALELEAHRKAQERRRLSLGAAYDNQDLIFPAPNGAPMNPRVFSRKFSRFRKRQNDAAAADGPGRVTAGAAEPRIALRWHDWRHSYAAQQLRAGEQVLVVSRALGHATAAFTLDVYGHVLPGEQQAAAQRHGERIDAARARGRAAAEA